MRAYFGLCLAFSLAKSSHADSTNDLGAQFFDAVQNDDIARAARLLKDGADINTQSPGGLQTPLMQSVLSGHEDMVQFLLSKGADTTIPEKDGYTPMHGAGFQGRAKIAAMLLNHGVGLRDKHPKDGYEPAGKKLIVFLPFNLFYSKLEVQLIYFAPRTHATNLLKFEHAGDLSRGILKLWTFSYKKESQSMIFSRIASK
mmetsp:Transcript_29500/g.59006  ORF Transcript_29500/g.59006 Transcript_29500/m.59006 type:complete len:200 (+) Transcript_29500:149-748(+)